MTTISGFIDNILSGAIPPERQGHYLELIRTEVGRLARLVASLLDISRIQAGDRKFEFVTFDVCEMARRILFSFEGKINAKRLDVEFECDEDRMQVNADHDAIYQILYNICDNAVKFSREDGKLRIALNAIEGNRVRVTVYNEGEGIAAEDVPFVFERFYKGDKSRGLDKSGVGLGLFSSKTIIDAHGQEIWVRSEQGSFCEFNFTLALAR
jgi:signal transduction histidine kinase